MLILLVPQVGGDSAVAVTGGAHVALSDLTLQGGRGTQVAEGTLAGAAILCTGDSQVTTSNVSFLGGTTGWGGSLYGDGCAAALTDSALQAGEADAGGAAFWKEGTLALDRVTVEEGRSTASGGCHYLGGGGGNVTFSMVDSVVQRCESEMDGAGGIFVGGSVDASCAGSSDVTAGIFDNAGRIEGGGVLLVTLGSSPTFTATACDFDDPASGADNEPDDVAISGIESYSEWGVDATFSCTKSGCE